MLHSQSPPGGNSTGVQSLLLQKCYSIFTFGHIYEHICKKVLEVAIGESKKICILNYNV